MSFLLNFASDKSFHLCPALNCHLLPCCGGHLNVACSGSSCLHLCSFSFFSYWAPFGLLAPSALFCQGWMLVFWPLCTTCAQELEQAAWLRLCWGSGGLRCWILWPQNRQTPATVGLGGLCTISLFSEAHHYDPWTRKEASHVVRAQALQPGLVS